MLEKVSGHAVSTREPSVTHGEGHGSRSITPEGHDPSEAALIGAADGPLPLPRSVTVGTGELPRVSTMPGSL